jgi:uncharacterized membrane protein (UPF0127 family)
MKIARILFGILAICAYAGCVVGSPSSETLSYISSSQQSDVDHAQSAKSKEPQVLPMKDITVGTDDVVAFSVQIAQTYDERMIGLMFRKEMPEKEGMVFLFEKEQPLSFWMKNTLIPLDIIFADKNWKIVSIQKSAQPCKADPCMLYPSSQNAQYVLEINAGLSDKLGIRVGDVIHY